ncbi:hypothetical protein [Spirillospora sp. NPDC047279]|uniref:hypothetical protein n=1 Tax=Spirillospora sp. NPDC047279 TaxID=3155478 RepID=UPI0033C6ACBB
MHSNIRELPEVRFLTSGDVTDSDRSAAEEAVRSTLSETSGEAASAQVTLSLVDDPSLPRPALAQVVVDLDGRRLRAQAAGPTLPEAVRLLQDRLAVRIAHRRAG